MRGKEKERREKEEFEQTKELVFEEGGEVWGLRSRLAQKLAIVPVERYRIRDTGRQLPHGL